MLMVLVFGLYYDRTAKHLQHDLRYENVERYASYTGMVFEMKAGDDTTQRMRVSLGDHSAFPITYSKGREPESETEIAILKSMGFTGADIRSLKVSVTASELRLDKPDGNDMESRVEKTISVMKDIEI